MATVSNNILWSTLTSVLQLYTGSIVFIVLAKLMSVNDFGILSFGFSLSAIVVIVADFGFSLMIIKDYPQQLARSSYLFNSLIAKALIALGTIFIVGLYLLFFYEADWLKVGAIYALFALVASFIIYLQALLRVQNRFKRYTGSNIVYAVTITISVLVYWRFQISLIALVFCLLLAKIIQLIWLLALCRSTFDQFSYSGTMVGKLIKQSWSFGVFNILGIFYFMVDTQIISLFLTAKDVALYQSVFRILLILMLLSDIISNVLLPYLSFKFYKQENISELSSKIYLYLLLVGCSLFLAFTTFKTELLQLLYTPEYLEATVLVLPFSIVLILRTVSTLLGNILTISNQQVARVVTVSLSLVLSLVLNLLLVPKYGIVAAAWTSVLVHIVLFGLYAMFCRKELKGLSIFSLWALVLMLFSGFLYYLINHLYPHNYRVVLISMAVWILLLVFTMSRNNNFIFLRKVLREKGVG